MTLCLGSYSAIDGSLCGLLPTCACDLNHHIDLEFRLDNRASSKIPIWALDAAETLKGACFLQLLDNNRFTFRPYHAFGRRSSCI
jgi:hypothetical protein